MCVKNYVHLTVSIEFKRISSQDPIITYKLYKSSLLVCSTQVCANAKPKRNDTISDLTEATVASQILPAYVSMLNVKIELMTVQLQEDCRRACLERLHRERQLRFAMMQLNKPQPLLEQCPFYR